MITLQCVSIKSRPKHLGSVLTANVHIFSRTTSQLHMELPPSSDMGSLATWTGFQYPDRPFKKVEPGYEYVIFPIQLMTHASSKTL